MLANLDWAVLWRPPFGDQILNALLLTVEIAFFSWIFAMILGVAVGVLREAPLAPERVVPSDVPKPV